MARVETTAAAVQRCVVAAFCLVLAAAVGLIGTSEVLSGAPTPRTGGAGDGGGERSVCGGLTADRHFVAERSYIGDGHACEHLRARAQGDRDGHGDRAGQAHGGVAGGVADHVRARVALAGALARLDGRPDRVGVWSRARSRPGTSAIAISAVLLHTGKVLMFGQTQDYTTAVGSVYDPATNTGYEIPLPGPIFCSSVTPLSDGRVLVVGGADPLPQGTEELWLFNPVAADRDPQTAWTRQPDMSAGRYYPTSTRLPGGRIIITAGRDADGTTENPNVEVFTPPAAGAAEGTVRTVGPPHATGWYPHQLVMRDGRLLQMDKWNTHVLDPRTWTWTNRRRLALEARAGGGAAHLMLPAGPKGSTKVMMIGGLTTGPERLAQTGTQVYNYARPRLGWTPAAPMFNPRSHMNVVQVPDGSAYAIGGNSQALRLAPRRQTLHYDPATGRWRGMAFQEPQRAYHSTALLLPDGRIMSAGDNGRTGGQDRIDFYRPPYLFKGKRPVIDRAPKRLAYGQQFRIRVRRSPATRAVLMAPAATTHANEMNARHVTLAVRKTATGLQAVAPSNANLAPAGHYMLFVLNAEGVPSRASWLRVGPR